MISIVWSDKLEADCLQKPVRTSRCTDDGRASYSVLGPNGELAVLCGRHARKIITQMFEESPKTVTISKAVR